jgi:hypothetical protein
MIPRVDLAPGDHGLPDVASWNLSDRAKSGRSSFF